MFERYTEKARRVIFFARYEASQFGAPAIEAEHILLGLLREDKGIKEMLFRITDSTAESIRKEIEGHATLRDEVSASVDLPLSAAAKRVLGYAADASDRLGHRHIGTEHLLLGVLKEGQSLASKILTERGLTEEKVLAYNSEENPASDSTTGEGRISATVGAIAEKNLYQPLMQIDALTSLLVQRGVISEQDLIEELASKYSLHPYIQARFYALLDQLVHKGVISEEDRERINRQGQ